MDTALEVKMEIHNNVRMMIRKKKKKLWIWLFVMPNVLRRRNLM